MSSFSTRQIELKNKIKLKNSNSVESLWTAPTETAKHLNLAIDETS